MLKLPDNLTLHKIIIGIEHHLQIFEFRDISPCHAIMHLVLKSTEFTKLTSCQFDKILILICIPVHIDGYAIGCHRRTVVDRGQKDRLW